MKNGFFVGRKEESALLLEAFNSGKSELVAVTGRRRVGKTYMIRHVLDGNISFEMTGMQRTPVKAQLKNFGDKITGYTKPSIPLQQPSNWQEAFMQLKAYLTSLKGKRKKVVFFDELPWLATAKSGFIEAFGYFWNDWASQNNILVVICGSAAGWMINKVVHHRGNLHNRITKRIHLKPFSLGETEQFLQASNIVLNKYQITQIYMVTGGVPHYLKEIRRGKSVAQLVDQMCFSANGVLRDEFDLLYASLYDKPDMHIAIIRALATQWKGLTRSRLLELINLSDGGSVTRTLMELEQSDFILSIQAFDKKKKDVIFRLVDNFSLFYLKFMEQKKNVGEGSFISLERTANWKTWTGYAFENICLLHFKQIKAAMGIAAVYSTACSYFKKGNQTTTGVQIDMLIDRADNIINLCEIKFYDALFNITKKYAEELRIRRESIRKMAPPKKSVLITLISCFGVEQNGYATELVQDEIKVELLFS